MPGAGKPTSVTVLAEALPGWVTAAPEARAPALESLIARGRRLPDLPADPDAARMTLFGLDARDGVPAAALSASATREEAVDGTWLRLDPVLLRASMTQVYLAGAGWADYDADEREAVESVIEAELAERDLALEGGAADHWLIRLAEPPSENDSVRFTALGEALGADVAELLPGGSGGRSWRALMNDIQIALHNLPANRARRDAGRPVVNGVWIWGAGPLPDPAGEPPFDAVLSTAPVSVGAARLLGIPVRPVTPDGGWKPAENTAFVDWPVDEQDPAAALAALDRYVASLRTDGVRFIHVFAGSAGWSARNANRLRFWRRRRPLAALFARDSR